MLLKGWPGVALGLLSVWTFAAGPASAAEPAASGGERRTWTSADGGFHVRARLVEARKESGGRVTVPRAKLSAADLAYLDQPAGAAKTAETPVTADAPPPAGRRMAALGRPLHARAAQHGPQRPGRH